MTIKCLKKKKNVFKCLDIELNRNVPVYNILLFLIFSFMTSIHGIILSSLMIYTRVCNAFCILSNK